MSDYMQGDKDNAVSVPFSDDEVESKKQQDLFEDEPSADASPEERKTHRQKRNDRIKRLLDEGNENKEWRKAAEEREQKRERELAELRGQLTAIAQQRQPPANDNGANPYEAALERVYTRQREAYTAAQAEIKAGTFDEKRSAHYERVAREIETEKARIHTQQAVDSQEHRRRQESAQQIWVNKYPDVYGNQQAYAYAEATFNQRRALGEQVTNQLVDEVMSEAMTRFRLGPKKAPSASEKSRMSGIAATGSGQSGGSNSGIQMTPQLRALAVSRYSDVSEEEAIKKWVNGPGKRLRDKKVI